MKRKAKRLLIISELLQQYKLASPENPDFEYETLILVDLLTEIRYFCKARGFRFKTIRELSKEPIQLERTTPQ